MDADKFMAAAGHYGNKSKELLKHYAEGLGFRYLSAQSKSEFLERISEFLSTKNEKPIVMEVFTDSVDESEALRLMYNIEKTKKGSVKNTVKKIIGEDATNVLKKYVKR